jgi:hypothetical protein
MLSFQRRFSQVVDHSKIMRHEVLMKLALRHAQAAYREKEIPVRCFLKNYRITNRSISDWGNCGQ